MKVIELYRGQQFYSGHFRKVFTVTAVYFQNGKWRYDGRWADRDAIETGFETVSPGFFHVLNVEAA